MEPKLVRVIFWEGRFRFIIFSTNEVDFQWEKYINLYTKENKINLPSQVSDTSLCGPLVSKVASVK